jgi:hypothetical protein
LVRPTERTQKNPPLLPMCFPIEFYAIAAAEEVAGFENRLASIDARLTVITWMVATVIALVAALFGKAFVT